MFAKLEIYVPPNKGGNLSVYRVFGEQGNDLGLYEAYDEADAVRWAEIEKGVAK